jgi:hypothetical protein
MIHSMSCSFANESSKISTPSTSVDTISLKVSKLDFGDALAAIVLLMNSRNSRSPS